MFINRINPSYRNPQEKTQILIKPIHSSFHLESKMYIYQIIN